MGANVSAVVQTAYDQQYSPQLSAAREMAGKYKAQRILDICRGHTFRKVLDCGCGEGSILKFVDEANAFEELHGIDISDSAIEFARKRKLSHLREIKKFDGYQIPYPDKAFDMAYCSHVIEHVEHPRLLLRELRRVSRFQVFEIPLEFYVGADRQVEHFLSYGHISVYSPTLFRFLLRSEGFTILDQQVANKHPDLIRYQWYQTQNRKWNWKDELSLTARPLINAYRRWRRGRENYFETCFSFYTCLCEGVSELKIFG